MTRWPGGRGEAGRPHDELLEADHGEVTRGHLFPGCLSGVGRFSTLALRKALRSARSCALISASLTAFEALDSLIATRCASADEAAFVGRPRFATEADRGSRSDGTETMVRKREPAPQSPGGRTSERWTSAQVGVKKFIYQIAVQRAHRRPALRRLDSTASTRRPPAAPPRPRRAAAPRGRHTGGSS